MENNLKIIDISSDLIDHPSFDGHQAVYRLEEPEQDFLAFIAIHRLRKVGKAFGATRYWKYSDESEAIRDVLRLSRGMSYKSAIAGLPYGGAKGVIVRRSGNNKKQKMKLYAQAVDSLNGQFITGTDVGLTKVDIEIMKSITPYIVGLNANPEEATAQSIFESIKSALLHVFKTDDLSERTFVVQGIGKVGGNLINLLSGRAKDIYVSDIDEVQLATMKNFYPDLKILKPDEVCQAKADVFCPCALGGVLNQETIPMLDVKIVVGGANNQLEDPECGKALYEKGILYVPDYIANSGGLISVVSEYESQDASPSDEEIKDRIRQIESTIVQIFDKVSSGSNPPEYFADLLARERFEES